MPMSASASSIFFKEPLLTFLFILLITIVALSYKPDLFSPKSALSSAIPGLPECLACKQSC